MPYTEPTLTDLITLALADVTASELDGADGLLPISNLVIMAMIQARLAKDHYGYLARVALNSTPFKSQDEWLDAWANLKGVYRKDVTTAGVAPAAPGTVTFTGSFDVDLPIGTTLRRGDGFTYTTVSDAAVGNDSTVTVQFIAATPGALGNAAAGVQLTIANPIQGINSTGATTTLIEGGADQETNNALRTRMFGVYAAPVAGGSQSDYVNWRSPCRASPGPGAIRTAWAPARWWSTSCSTYPRRRSAAFRRALEV